MIKKIVTICISVTFAFGLFTTTCFAEQFSVNDDEMFIDFNTDTWKVFTEDNLKDNKDILKSLGTNPKQMKSTMKESNAKVVAIKNKQSKREEILVRVHSNSYINTMSTLSDEETKALKKGVKEQYSSEIDNYKSELFVAGNTKWIKMTGMYDENHRAIQYFTIVNGNDYLVAAQKVTAYTSEDKSELENMINSIHFDVDEEKADNDLEGYIKAQQNNLEKGSSLQTRIFSGIAIFLAVIAALYIKNRNRKKKIARMNMNK